MIAYSIADQEFARGRSLGILNNSLGLLQELVRQTDPAAITVFANQSLAESHELPPGVVVENHDEALGGGFRRILWDQWGVYQAARKSKRKWLMMPKGFASFCLTCPIKLAVIINDGMTDHYARHHPEYVKRSEFYYFTWALRGSMRQAQVIFTISEFTADEVRRLARRDGIHLPPIHAVGVGFNPPPPEVPPGPESRRGLLVLTSRMPHKLTAPTVHHLLRWQDQTGFQEPVHLVGSLPDDFSMPNRPGWTFHPRPDNEAYRNLMRECRAMIYASEYEGFGMPPVEAALAGMCPVYSDIPTLREVMEGRGRPFDNRDFTSFAEALTGGLQATQMEIRNWAEALHQKYNWPRIARRVVNALTEAS